MTTFERLWQPHPRVRALIDGEPNSSGRCVLYWMQRAQRGRDNAALNLAIALGNSLKLPVVTVFGLTSNYPGAQRRQYRFLVDGLVDVHSDLDERCVPFVVRLGDPAEVVVKLAHELQPAVVVGDENPLRIGISWRNRVAEKLKCPFRLVDADVVVPSSLFPKDEWSARTLRIKLHKVLHEFLKPMPNPSAQIAWPADQRLLGEVVDVDKLMSRLEVQGVAEVPGYRGGANEAEARLSRFVKDRLHRYAKERNEPTPYSTSELSAHLHFGHINPLTMALAARNSDAGDENIDGFIEELVVRRELAINFVVHHPDDYDRLEGCPDWARATLEKHRTDPRPHRYQPEELETARTHDPLWNASQKEMMLTGRMHNYLRMYWAKKILEWSPDAATAFQTAIDLNDRYEMDGRDANGYEGVAWAIGGKHDRPWPERPIFGTVRFMSYESTRKKFDSRAYIERVQRIERGELPPV